jgi:hypothetical protein
LTLCCGSFGCSGFDSGAESSSDSSLLTYT